MFKLKNCYTRIYKATTRNKPKKIYRKVSPVQNFAQAIQGKIRNIVAKTFQIWVSPNSDAPIGRTQKDIAKGKIDRIKN